MLKQLAVACVALAFATQAASQSIIQKAKERQAQEQKAEQQRQQQQQQQAGAGQSAPEAGQQHPRILKKKLDNCNRQADAKKLGGDARKRHVDQCMQQP